MGGARRGGSATRRGEEVARDDLRALVDQLVEGVLPVGARLAPDDRAGLVCRPACRRGRRTCRCSPCRPAGSRRRSGACTGRTAGSPAVWAPKKLLYQMPIRPSITGRFFSSGAVRKCWSIAWPPSSNCSKLSMPMETAIDRPIADQSEYRPPTQSQNSNMFFVSMPNFVTSFSLVERATKCLATCVDVLGLLQEPVLGGGGVGDRLLRGERLAGDDEQRRLGVQLLDRLGDVRAVDVGDEVDVQARLARTA